MMLIVMRPEATVKQVSSVLQALEERGWKPHLSKGEFTTIVGVMGDERSLAELQIERLPGVEKTVPLRRPFKLASREFHPDSTTVRVSGTEIGGKTLVVMAGPCAVESYEQTLATARAVKKAGARILRGGAYKPRTSPYSFQGLGPEGLKILAAVRRETGLPVVTEVLSPHDVPLVAEHADILQVGARNMQNFALLEAVGKSRKPVLLKRGMMSTLEELYMSAEYILSNENFQVILCERGIRTFEKYTRNTLDITAVPVTKRLSHLPILVDPSHATGDRALVRSAALAGVAAGADGLIVEVHPDPERALCDGPESLPPEEFDALMQDVRRVAGALGKET